MKWIPIILTVICINAVAVSNAFARPCLTFVTIKSVRVNANGDVLFRTWGNQRVDRLAATADSPARESMLHLLLHAATVTKEKNYGLNVAYPEGYNCKEGDTTTPAEFISVYDPVIP